MLYPSEPKVEVAPVLTSTQRLANLEASADAFSGHPTAETGRPCEGSETINLDRQNVTETVTKSLR
jgi:hypothetical protein